MCSQPLQWNFLYHTDQPKWWLYLLHMGQPRAYCICITIGHLISSISDISLTTQVSWDWHWPEQWLYSFHTAWLMLYYSCTAQLGQSHLHTVALPYISPAYLDNAFKYIWYEAYYICPELIFQCEFNSDVCIVIRLPYLAIISRILDMEYSIHVWDPFFNMNSTVIFVLWLDYPIW
jgi:hypothetical protein